MLVSKPQHLLEEAAGLMGTIRHRNGTDSLTAEGLEIALHEQVAQVDDTQGIAQVGLIRTESAA